MDEKTSRNHYFNLTRTSIIYGPGGNCTFIGCTKIAGAHARSFRPLNRFYGIDRNSAFYEAEMLSGETSKGFRVASGPYAVGSQGVYWHGQIIRTANPATFSATEFLVQPDWPDHYGFDDEHVYCGDVIISLEPDNFRALEKTSYFADSSDVYWIRGSNCESLGANPQTFQFLQKKDGSQSMYMKDSFHVFDSWTNEIIEGVDAESFEPLCEGVGPPHNARDSHGVYKYNFGPKLVKAQEDEVELVESCKID